MSRSRSDRRRQNKLNASHSKGPTSPSGREAAKVNAITHGWAANVLTTETPEQVQANADSWTTYWKPQGHDEETLVHQLALASLRVDRIARAEIAILAEQVASAKTDREHDDASRLLDVTNRFRSDPARTRVELMSFGSGVNWLLERWQSLEDAFRTYNCWNNATLIWLALRLEGFDPQYLYAGSLRGYELAVHAISCVPNSETEPDLQRMLETIHAEWMGQHGTKTRIPIAEALRSIRTLIETRMTELKKRAAEFKEREAQSLESLSDCALTLHDTPRNRLLLRYMNSARSHFDKLHKMLEKVQMERQRAAESTAKTACREASKGGLPNEAELVAQTRAKQIGVGDCIKVKDAKDEVVGRSDGNIVSCKCVDMMAEPVSEVVPTPETVV
jgi:hypothetical protein